MCSKFMYCIAKVCACLHLIVQFTDIPQPLGMRAEVTADNTSIRVLWEWSNEGVFACLDSVRVDYQPEGGSLMMYTVDSATATSATLSNLQCNTQYFITVRARGSVLIKSSTASVVSVPARGTIVVVCIDKCFLLTHYILPLQSLLLPLGSLLRSP